MPTLEQELKRLQNTRTSDHGFGMPDIVSSITGFKETDALLNELTRDAREKVLKSALLKANKPIKEKAVRFTPRHTGKLREAVHVSREVRRSGFVTSSLGYRTKGSKAAPHAHLIEYGTEERFVPIMRGGRQVGERSTGSITAQKNMTRAYMQSGGAAMVKVKFVKELNLAIIRASKKTKNRKSIVTRWI